MKEKGGKKKVKHTNEGYKCAFGELEKQ